MCKNEREVAKQGKKAYLNLSHMQSLYLCAWSLTHGAWF